MTTQAAGGTIVIVAAADPVPAGDSLLSALFVAAARLHGTRAIEDVASGPAATAILKLNGVAAAEVSAPHLEQALRDALAERGFDTRTVDITSVSTGLSSVPGEAADRWALRL